MAELIRRPGRPTIREGQKSTRMGVTIADGDFDRACQLAHRRGLSLPAVLRLGLTRLLRDDAAKGGK